MLNAFRHQRDLHQDDGVAHGGVKPVLNAFRHQRDLHALALDDGALVVACSTPFGIRGIYTGADPRQRHRLRLVLNAFRHQRDLHCTAKKTCLKAWLTAPFAWTFRSCDPGHPRKLGPEVNENRQRHILPTNKTTFVNTHPIQASLGDKLPEACDDKGHFTFKTSENLRHGRMLEKLSNYDESCILLRPVVLAGFAPSCTYAVIA